MAADKPSSGTEDATECVDTVDPVKCVVIGGGYAGSRVAYQLDSIFHVTLVDTKNYYEASDEITSLLTAPDDNVFEERMKELHALHRYYLRRARVITNRAVDVDEKHVTLADGRKVPYDVLVLAIGETRIFPFAAEAQTLDVREAQLREYQKFLADPSRKKVAVIGGGPAGISLANCLAMRYLDKEVHLFHSTSTFAPQLPYEARERIEAVLMSNTHVHLHRNAVVTGVNMSVDNTHAAPVEAPVSKKKWWQFGTTTPNDSTAADAPDGLRVDSKVKYSLDVSLREDTKVKIPSVVYQVYTGEKPKHEIHRGKEVGTETIDDFDYVISLTGNRPNGRKFFGDSKFLAPHIDADGHFIASKYMQLLGNPRIFAVGRCNNFQWVRSMGNSDFQARTLFRNMLSVANMQEVKTTIVPTMAPLLSSSMAFPRILVPMDEFQAVGSIAWSGSTVGPRALKELNQDRKYYLKEFSSPIFFKQMDDKKVRDSFDAFFKLCVTDVGDFDLDG